MTSRAYLLAAALCAGLCQTVFAADMGFKAPPPPAPAPTWTGFYIGGFAGAGWGTDSASLSSVSFGGNTVGIGLPIAQVSNSGFLGGGQVGYNYQAGWMVFGVEGDFSGTGITGTAPCVVLFSCQSRDNWLATVSGRFGGVTDNGNLLVYVKGGGAWLNETGSLTNTLPILNIITTTSASNTFGGWLLGLGTEYKFTANWSAMIEYDYMDFGTSNTTFPSPIIFAPSATGSVAQTNKLSVVKIGVNYKFF